MSKFDIRLQFECQNRISNVKIRRYSARIRMSKIENRKAKNEIEKRKRKGKYLHLKSKNEKQTNFTLLYISVLFFNLEPFLQR